MKKVFLRRLQVSYPYSKTGSKTVNGSRLLSFNRIQSRVVTGLLTGHHFLGRHLYTSKLTKVPCVGGVEQRRKTQLTFCPSVKPWRHSYIFFFILVTVHLGIILINNQLDAQFLFYIYLFRFSTCFERVNGIFQ
jgi:hypothetical protein